MSLLNYYHFLVVAEELNITNAAKRLYISQQALSNSIQRLEKKYNSQLFTRTPTLRLTPAGELMLVHAKRMVLGEQELSRCIQAYNLDQRPRIATATVSGRSEMFLPLIWDRFLEKYPNALLSVEEGLLPQLNAKLAADQIDLFFCFTNSQSVQGKTIDLMEERFCMVLDVSLIRQIHPNDWREFIWKECGGAQFSDFADFPFSLPPSGNTFREKIDPTFGRAGLNPLIVLSSANQRLVFEMSRQGRFVGVLSDALLFFLMRDKKDLEGLCVFPISTNLNMMPMKLAYNAQTAAAKAVKDFISCSVEAMEDFRHQVDSYFNNYFQVQREQYTQ